MEIKSTPNLAHNVAMNQLTLDTLTKQPIRAVNDTEAINKISFQIDPIVMRSGAPVLNQPAAQLNRAYEISKDPPGTVLKFTDPTTKEVVLQLPSEASINVYKSTQAYLEKQNAISQAIIKIVV